MTPEVQKRICDAIRAGNYYQAACAYAGIGYSTFRRWMTMGEEAKRGKYREFWEAVTRAELEAEARLVAQWQQHMPNDYRAIRDFLERRFPERWGKAAQASATVRVDVSAFSKVLDEAAADVWDEDEEDGSKE